MKRDRPGRLPSLGQDHDAGHRSYVAALGGDSWLRTKPFSDPPMYELARCLHSFAHIVEALGLGPGARVLDVGCGPGWLSEFLARCGYVVTGVDVSEDMIAIARERLESVRLSVGSISRIEAEFAAMPVRELPWEARFDAAVLYDAMHHFDEELETLQAIRRALIPGGRIYIHEGVRPPTGSAGEQELIEEMRRYGTLESPFDPEYLLEVVEAAGFRDVRRLVEIDRLVTATAPRHEMKALRRQMRAPETNTVIAVNPIAAGNAAQTTLAGSWEVIEVITGPDIAEWSFAIRATNTGSREWPASTMSPPARGVVTVAPFAGSNRARREFGRLALPWTVLPGQSIDVTLTIPAADLAGSEALLVDLVAESVAWFADLGSDCLRIPLTSRP